MSEVVMPKRSKRFGVGKEIGGSVYIHRLYEEGIRRILLQPWPDLTGSFAYTIVKYNLRTHSITLIHSPDFDTVDEPMLGECWTIPIARPPAYRSQPTDPFIYHHKWLMVADDYEGFDVRASIERSRRWLALPGIDKSRIGRRSFWMTHVVPRLTD